MKKTFLLLALLLASLVTTAYAGIIKGSVKDSNTSEFVIGASVVIQGTTTGAVTDLEGNFTIDNVPEGTHTLVISFVSYKNTIIPNVKVEGNNTTIINTFLEENIEELAAVEITAARQRNTDIAVITEIKQADLIAVGISSQQISKSLDRDAAQVIQRVPGVTIIDNRFVMVRGLNERYNSVRLNGIITPSTEVDSRAFSFDIVPSGLIERMLVYKSGSAELPGDFAGAIIDIYTKNIVEKNATSVSVSTSYRAGTTFNEINTYKGSPWDLVGFGNRSRSLPAQFSSENLRSINDPEAVANASRALPNTWALQRQSALPDVRVGLNLSRKFYLGDVKVNNITSLGYSYTQQVLNVNLNNYEDFNSTTGKSPTTYSFNDTQGNQNGRLGLISNWAFQINSNNKIEFRNMYNRTGNKQSIYRTGEETVQGFEMKNYALNYISRGIYSGQLQGTHALSQKTDVNWILGFANTKRDQPDFRRARTQRVLGSDNDFEVVIPPSASTFDAGRFYSKLNENVYTVAGNLEYKLKEETVSNDGIKIKSGYYLEYKKRDFDIRWLAYSFANSQNQVASEFAGKTLEEVFSPANIGPSKLLLSEGTNTSDPYSADNILAAAYSGIALPLGRNFNLSTGLRYEYNRQRLESGNEKVDNPVGSILPFANLAYHLNEHTLLRLAYSKTVNRPEFRELAPFPFYNFEANNTIIGNKDLKSADIHNIDLRWEIYPGEGENISLGVFYKNFQNPIEMKQLAGSNPIYKPFNAKSATNYGIEVEIRKSLRNLTSSDFLGNITFLLNSSLIQSSIDIGKSDFLEEKRPLQGQSPYIVNAGIYYNDPVHDLQVNLLYNVFGKRIVLVGDLQENPTWWELPRDVLDLTISKRLGEKYELKFGIQDILNQKSRIVQNPNYNGEVKSKDEPIMSFRRGQYTTIGLTYNF